MVLLHFYSTGRWFFLIISIGFVLIGTEEFVHAIFSFSGFWPEPFPTVKLAISTTWLTGHFVLLTSFFIALIFGERRVVPAKRALYAVIYNIIGFICTAFVALLIFKAPFLPGFVQLGTITKKLIELSFALLFFVALLFYAKIYLKQQSRSPLLWGIVACIIFRVLAHIFVFDARAFYDSHWDTAHLLVFLSYFFPIFGVWGETLKLQRSAKAQVLELGKEIAQRRQLEEVLKRDEALFRELYDHMKNGSAIFTVMNDGSKGSDYIIKKINRAGLEMEGKALEEVVGKRFIDIRPAIDSYGLIPVMKKVWETEKSAIFPTKIYVDERHSNYYDYYIFKLPSGEIVTLYNDVSESKRMEEQLRESEERFRTIACNTPDHILVQDRDLRYTFVVNPQLGLTEADMLGKTDRDILNKEEAENLIAIKTKVMETGVPFHLEASLQNLKGETEYFDGSYIPKFDSTGKSDGLIGYFRNITERKRAEDALQESDVSYRALFENIHSGVAVYTVIDDGRDFIFKDFNRAGEKIDHDQRERLIGKSIFEVRPGVEQFGLTEVFRQVWQTGEPAYHPVTLYQDDLLSGWYENFVYKLPSGEIVAVFEDITERKQAEEEIGRKSKELQEKNDELNRFVYAVSHDLRSPLVTIQTFQGHLEQDLRNRDAALVAKDLGYIRGAADKMGRLLDEIRRLSRVGRIVNPSEEAPLQEIVKEALNLVAGRITDRGMRVDLTEEPVVLYGDRTRLVEIFLNLVDNAAKFMGDQPAPRVEIGVEQAGEELVLHVRDNGIGIGPEVQPLVFGLFHKLDPGSEGEGIGLALVKRIVELHGGRIWVESEGLGKGTTFRFTLAKTRRAAVCGF